MPRALYLDVVWELVATRGNFDDPSKSGLPTRLEYVAGSNQATYKQLINNDFLLSCSAGRI
jgi:hypothetical protein